MKQYDEPLDASDNSVSMINRDLENKPQVYSYSILPLSNKSDAANTRKAIIAAINFALFVDNYDYCVNQLCFIWQHKRQSWH